MNYKNIEENEYKPCPFCGMQPTIDKDYAPSIVECRCANSDCSVQPVLIVQVECEMSPDGQSYSPLFEKAYPLLLERWNSRTDRSDTLTQYKEALRKLVERTDMIKITDTTDDSFEFTCKLSKAITDSENLLNNE